jgi:hypothetical protein
VEFGRRGWVSGLLLMVCFLVLMPLSPASSTAPMWSSTFSHSWGSGWNPSFTHSHWDSSWHSDFSYTGSWHRSWTWTGTWHGSWSWSGTWSRTWTATWHTWGSATWSRHTQGYPTHTWTRYAPTWTQYVPSYTWTQYAPPPQPIPGCYPYEPYCNGCYPSYPYCNIYQSTQTVTSYPPAPQTVVVTQSLTQTAVPPQIISSDFFLSAWPSTVALPPGDFIGSTNFVLVVTSVGGWSGQIQFVTSALPQGITLSNLPPTYQLNAPDASWSIQMTIDGSAKTGDYPLVITGLSGSLIHSAIVTIDVSNPNS